MKKNLLSLALSGSFLIAYFSSGFTQAKRNKPNPANMRKAITKSASIDSSRFSTSSWCEDNTTLCWNRKRAYLNGLRFVFEPQLGMLFQNGKTRFKNQTFSGLEKIGLETNLYRGYVSVQTLLIYPSTIKFDKQSPIRKNLINQDGKVGVDYGFSFGLSFFDGIVAVGAGGLYYDKRDFVDASKLPDQAFRDGFFYFNLQPISAVKATLKRINKSNN